jgi:hypothetical protein
MMFSGRPAFPAPAQPAPDEMDKLNAAFKELMIKNDPSLKTIFENIRRISRSQDFLHLIFLHPKILTKNLLRRKGLLAAGWGYVTLETNSIQADNGAGLTRGIIGLVNKGQPRKPDDWGSLEAWAWGAARGLDYLETGYIR